MGKSIARRHTGKTSLQQFWLSAPSLPPSQLQSSKESLKREIQNISTSFEDLDDQVKSDIGYSSEDNGTAPGTEALKASGARPYSSTQAKYEMRTKLRCTREECSWGGGGGQTLGPGCRSKHGDPRHLCLFATDVVNKAIDSCYRWFNKKYQRCIQQVQAPFVNNLLCLPMKFKFLCRIAKR